MSKEIINFLKLKYKNKKILVVGLGLQGGGVGIAKFFAELGAKVTVTDKKSKEQLLQSIDRLKSFPITFHFGENKLEDFLNADVIFKGPSVPGRKRQVGTTLADPHPQPLAADLCPPPGGEHHPRPPTGLLCRPRPGRSRCRCHRIHRIHARRHSTSHRRVGPRERSRKRLSKRSSNPPA